MNLPSVFLIALALSMDSFAVAVGCGLASIKTKLKNILKCGLIFGICQGIMPVIGFLLGVNLKTLITGIDHWIAFGLLAIIGGRMVIEGMEKKKKNLRKNPFENLSLFYAGIATSIDALAIGIGFAFLEVNILSAAVVIGIVTFIISISGVFIGNKIGGIFEKKTLFSGGVVLIGIGLKILFQHLYY